MTSHPDPSPRAVTASGIDVVRSGRLPWGESMVKHRQAGTMRHKRLFDGTAGSADNYNLAYADESREYYSPSHRHLWDQIRYCAAGAVPIGRTMQVRAGEVAYFPEGVRYGPQEGGPDREVLVLQFGGSSGNGYLSPEQIDRGRTELAAVGSFDGGHFHRHGGGGERRRQDAYEAVWEHVTGVSAVYPDAIVEAPIVMRPAAFPAVEVDGHAGTRRRRLGTFEPRGVTVDVYELSTGSTVELRCDDGVVLAWVTRGTGAVGGEPIEPETALRVRAGESDVLRANESLSILRIGLPALS